jgi:hypothetical protein
VQDEGGGACVRGVKFQSYSNVLVPDAEFIVKPEIHPFVPLKTLRVVIGYVLVKISVQPPDAQE